MTAVPQLFIGVDVQLSRGCPVVALDRQGRFVCATWLDGRGDEPSLSRAHLARRLRGFTLGGGDGLGTIVLPGPRRSPGSAVHRWPAELEHEP